MSEILKPAVSVFLILLYSVFGVTGQSAHYLFQHVCPAENGSAGLADENSRAAKKVYVHRHGKDRHWHSHHATDSRSEEPATTSSETGEVEGLALARLSSSHIDHACPLLSVLRILELSLGGVNFRSPQLIGKSAPLASEQTSVVSCLSSAHLARGPPQLAVA